MATAPPTTLLLDSGPLAQLCHPSEAQRGPIVRWLLAAAAAPDRKIYVPEIADYEVRRKLVHLASVGRGSWKGVERLDRLSDLLTYLPLDTATIRVAAGLWAEVRRLGLPTAAVGCPRLNRGGRRGVRAGRGRVAGRSVFARRESSVLGTAPTNPTRRPR